MLLTLNVVAPTSTDVRVVKYVVPIVAQVKGRVIEVPVANNQAVKKGDVLFRIDPTPYQSEVRALEAQLVSDEAKVGRRAGRGRRNRDPPARCAVGRAAAGRTTQPGDQPDRLVAGVARTGAPARRAEHRARRRRRRQSVRPRAGADQRQRADRADRRGACRRAGGAGKSCRAASTATSRPSRVSRRRSPRRTRRSASRQAQMESTRAKLAERAMESRSDHRGRAQQRHDGERDAAARDTS